MNGENVMDALLLDFPESFESDRLTIRALVRGMVLK